MIKYFKGDFVFSKIRCRPFQKKQSSFPNTSDNNFDNLVSFSLLLASFHYYWLFWLTQSCHTYLALSLLWHIIDYSSWTLSSSEHDKALLCSELNKALSDSEFNKVYMHMVLSILEISGLSISLLVKKNHYLFWKSSIADAGDWTWDA